MWQDPFMTPFNGFEWHGVKRSKYFTYIIIIIVVEYPPNLHYHMHILETSPELCVFNENPDQWRMKTPNSSCLNPGLKPYHDVLLRKTKDNKILVFLFLIRRPGEKSETRKTPGVPSLDGDPRGNRNFSKRMRSSHVHLCQRKLNDRTKRYM